MSFEDLKKSGKKVRLTSVGLNCNEFSLLGAFRRHAIKDGWSHEEIRAVINECVRGDYAHLLRTLMEVCK